MLFVSLLPAQVSFADDITGTALETELREAVEREILYGFGEGTYKPDLKVTRGEFANFMARALKLPEAQHKFADVAITSALAPGINSATEAGIMSGYTDGKFRPEAFITRGEMAIIIKNAVDYKNVIVEYQKPEQLSDYDKLTSSVTKLAVANMVSMEITMGFKNSDGVTYRFEPGWEATRAQSAAFIIRMIHAIEDYENQLPGEPGEPDLEKPFKIANINASGELEFTTLAYATYADAIAKWDSTTSQVVTFDQKVIKMTSGLAYASPSIGKSTTLLYSDPELTKQVTYIRPQEEMRYLSSDETTVKVFVGGRTAYAKQSEINLIPTKMVENQNQYIVNSSNSLVLKIYSPVTETFGSLEVGKAPSFLKQGITYYSWDGKKFYTSPTGGSSSYVGEFYPYYQYLSARSKSQYTAEQLNQFIDKRLGELEALYVSNPTTYAKYKDATKISKVIGLGTHIKEVEAKYNINALLILGMAFHEGDYGMSGNSLKLNNLFGIKAYDSNPEGAEPYPTPEDSVDALVNSYLNKNYVPVYVPGTETLAPHSNGAVPGNKFIGVNVKYASDAYWGAKVAGHMYRIDRALGFKDYNLQKEIGLTNTTGTNARTSASSTISTNIAFKYPTANRPVIIVEEVKAADNWTWYKILSDQPGYEYVYIREDLINKLPTN